MQKRNLALPFSAYRLQLNTTNCFVRKTPSILTLRLICKRLMSLAVFSFDCAARTHSRLINRRTGTRVFRRGILVHALLIRGVSQAHTTCFISVRFIHAGCLIGADTHITCSLRSRVVRCSTKLNLRNRTIQRSCCRKRHFI